MDYFSLFIVLVVVVGIVIKLYCKLTYKTCKSTKRLDGKTVLITGGTSGIGLEIAKDLARRGARIIVACPFETEGKTAERIIRETSGNTNVFFKQLDLASLQDTRKFANDIKSEDCLDILINNAGVWLPPRTTEDGMDITMQVNYYSHFLLTILLLPLLKKTAKISDEPVRIINTSSEIHQYARKSVQEFNEPSTFGNYADSKLCIAIISRELAKRLKNTNIVVNAVSPGRVGTRIYNGTAGNFIGNIWRLTLVYFAKTPLDGSQTALHVALDDKAGEVSGEYFENCEILETNSTVHNEALATEIFRDSVERVKLSENELKQALDKSSYKENRIACLYIVRVYCFITNQLGPIALHS